MKIVVACDSFKESMSALQACKAIERGIHSMDSNIEVVCIPMSDGGEGSALVLNETLKGEKIYIEAHNAYLEKIETYYYRKEDVALIEMALVCGLEMIPIEKRHSIHSSSYGMGEVMKHAIEHGCTSLIIGLGGSATNDGGIGMLASLGCQFFDEQGKELEPVISNILKMKTIHWTSFPGISIQVACDVQNPYCGIHGATYTFGKQKGATQKELEYLETCLTHLNSLLKIHNAPCTGAAGGTSGALYALGAKLCSGIELVIQQTGFEQALMDADYCFTGEGSIDFQTKNGKTIAGIASMCKKHKIPLIAFAGRITHDISELYEMGLTSCFSITNEAKSLQDALKDGEICLEKTVENVIRLLKVKI
ncbi:MAG: glycerate kinase [Floccifex sp.]